MSIYINEVARKKYTDNLKSFANLKETLSFSDKVIFACSARLLDPYQGTTAESRDMLKDLPSLDHHGLKRTLIVAMINLGYDEAADREILDPHLLQPKLKPLEANLHENNQAYVIRDDLDLKLYPDALSDAPRDGYEIIYTNENTIPEHLQGYFHEKKDLIRQELPTHHALKKAIIEEGFLDQITRTGFIVFCATIFLKTAVESKLISQTEANDFASAQLALIQKQIKLALARKNKSEREMTNLLRVYEMLHVEYLARNAV